MDQFYQVLGREMGLGVRSPEELRTRANRLVISLYGDYVRQLGPPEAWTLSDVEAVARYAFMARETNGMQQPSERFGDAVLALDRIEANSLEKLQPLRVRASLLPLAGRVIDLLGGIGYPWRTATEGSWRRFQLRTFSEP